MKRHLSSSTPAEDNFKLENLFLFEKPDQTIHTLLEYQSLKYKDKVAIKSTTFEMTYREINNYSNIAMNEIVKVTGSQNRFISIFLDHDAPMIVSMIAVLKSGNGYVCLEPHVPESITVSKLIDSQSIGLITNDQYLELAVKLVGNDIPIINIDRLTKKSELNFSVSESPDNYAYLLYTTGSTGKPKGTLQNHRNFLYLMRNYTKTAKITHNDTISVIASFSFSAAIMDIFGALLNGATACIWNLKLCGFEKMPVFLKQNNVTIFHSSPTAFRHLCKFSQTTDLKTIRLVYLGGEGASRKDFELYKCFFPFNTSLICSYGSTELGIITQFVTDVRQSIESYYIPMGSPVDFVTLFILDKNGNEVPDGQIGEIAISSPYLALGYWNRHEINKKQFFKKDEKRIFLTRDSAKKIDGNYIYYGRVDSQINLRGYRIILDEMDMLIKSNPSVQHSITLLRNDISAEPCLVSYIILQPGSNLSTIGIRNYLKPKLPEVMIPSYFVFMESFPLTNNGKTDKKMLPKPLILRNKFSLENRYVPPRNEVEKKLCDIWANTIKTDIVGLHDNFFSLGGTSLSAMEMVVEINNKFGLSIPLINLLELPDVHAMAKLINNQLNNRGHMIQTRFLSFSDIPDILSLPKNKNELLYAFPHSQFPLTADHFYSVINTRKESTVAILNNSICGILSLYDIKEGKECFIGNLMVDYEKRLQGIGRVLIETISEIAIRKYSVKRLKISCWAENNSALLFYKKLGFLPYDVIDKKIENKKIAVLLLIRQINR